MKKQIAITLFGAAGTRTLEITPRGGFPTRQVKASREVSLPSISTPAKPKPEQTPPIEQKTAEAPPSLFEVLRFMEASENHRGWLIIDEILFVATTQFKMTFNHNTLLDALRHLFKNGVLGYKRNRFNQHTFCLIEKGMDSCDLKALLAEVDALMDEGGAV